MGLITSLCSEMEITSRVLAHIVGLPYEWVKRWEIGGVPLRYQGDFRLLEELLTVLRERSAAPARTAIRVRLPELGGRSALEALTQSGPLTVLECIAPSPLPEAAAV